MFHLSPVSINPGPHSHSKNTKMFAEHVKVKFIHVILGDTLDESGKKKIISETLEHSGFSVFNTLEHAVFPIII